MESMAYWVIPLPLSQLLLAPALVPSLKSAQNLLWQVMRPSPKETQYRDRELEEGFSYRRNVKL